MRMGPRRRVGQLRISIVLRPATSRAAQGWRSDSACMGDSFQVAGVGGKRTSPSLFPLHNEDADAMGFLADGQAGLLLDVLQDRIKVVGSRPFLGRRSLWEWLHKMLPPGDLLRGSR